MGNVPSNPVVAALTIPFWGPMWIWRNTAGKVLFPDMPDGPKISDLRITVAEEGAPIYRVLGQCRVPGTLIWASDLIPKKHNNNQGKGGSGGNFATYTYSMNLAIAICEGPIVRVDEILADGKTLWKNKPDVNVLAFDPASVTVANGVQHNGSTWTQAEYKSPNGGPDLSEFKSGRTVEVTGWTGGQATNNSPAGGWTVFSSSKNGLTGETFVKVERLSSLGNFVAYAGGLGQSVNLKQKNPQFSIKQLQKAPVFYLGDEFQTADPTIMTTENTANIAAFRGLAYFMLLGLEGFDFGNRVPIIEAIVTVDESITVGQGIERICGWSKMDASEVDASACTAAMKGYMIRGSQRGADALQPLLQVYDIVTQGRFGKTYFFPRNTAAFVDVLEADLGTRPLNSPSIAPVVTNDRQDLSVPRMVNVRYTDIDRHYQRGKQDGIRVTALYGPTVNLPVEDVVLNAGEARALGDKEIWRALHDSRVHRIQVPPSYGARLRESDVARFTSDGRQFNVLLQQVDKGDNGMLICMGVREDQRVATQAAVFEDSGAVFNGTGNQFQSVASPVVVWHLIDIAPFRDEDAVRPVLYLAAALADPRLPYSGAFLYESSDSGETWTQKALSTIEATMGYVVAPPDTGAAPDTWDTTSVLDVFMFHGELEGTTDALCLAGYNRAVVGDEIIGFVEVELIAPFTYRLTRLRRGLQATEEAIAGQVAGARFVVVSNVGLVPVSMNVAALGETRMYKCIPSGGILEHYGAANHTHALASVRPPAPLMTAARDGSNNVTFTVERRSRAITRLALDQHIPWLEARVAYTIEIRDPTDTTTTRSKSQSTTADSVDFSYTAIEQTADGYTPGDPIVTRRYAHSEWLGQGQVMQETL